MHDFAHAGVIPDLAMQMMMDVANGESVELPKAKFTPAEMREWIDGAPEEIPVSLNEDEAATRYNNTARRAAKYVLAHYAAHPGDRFVAEPVLWAMCRAMVDDPDSVASISTFQWGWAVNAARYVLGWGIIPNPVFRPMGTDTIGLYVMTRAELAAYT